MCILYRKVCQICKESVGLRKNALSNEEISVKGIEELKMFVKEVRLPVTFCEFGRASKDVIDKVAKKTMDSCNRCILRSLADSDAFQSGRYAEHNGRPKTLNSID